MPVASSSDRNKPKQYTCNLCSKTFDDIETLNSHKRLDHGSTENGERTKPHEPAGVG